MWLPKVSVPVSVSKMNDTEMWSHKVSVAKCHIQSYHMLSIWT